MSMGEPDIQFKDMNAGAHRRPATKIAAPALIWHRIFWKPPVAQDNGGNQDHSDQRWWDSIDLILYALYHNIKMQPDKARFECPNQDENVLYLFKNKVNLNAGAICKLEMLKEDEKSVRHEVFSIRANYDGAIIIVSARLHFEYVELMICAELPFERNFGKKSKLISSINCDFIKVHEFIKSNFSQISNHSVSNNNFTMPHSESDQFSKTKNNIIYEFKNWVDLTLTSSLGSIHETKADIVFRNIGVNVVDIVGVIFGMKLSFDKLSLENAILPNIDSENERHTIKRITIGTNFSSDNELDIVDALIPACLSFSDKEIENKQGEPEYTASLFQDGEVLYMSSLGRLTANNKTYDPVIYTLLVSHSNRWRLGRLIDRLNSLGTLRIVALRDIVALTEVSNKIDRLSAILSRTPINISANDLDDIKKEFSNIENGSSQLDRVLGGISYRVEKSRHYVKEFKSLIEVMRTRKINGFQNYDNFVRRRVYDAFDFIDTIGNRYERLRNDIDFRAAMDQKRELRHLYDAILASTVGLGEQTKKGNELLDAANTNAEKANGVLEAVNFETISVKKLVDVVERLSIIPLTYYAGTLLEHLFKTYFYGDYITILSYIGGFFISLIIQHYIRRKVVSD